MNARRIATPLLALAIAAIASGCSTNHLPTASGPGITGIANSAASPASAADGALATDMQVADSLRHGARGPVGLPIEVPSGCLFDAATSTFTCSAELGPDGLTHARSYQFLGAAGTAQSAYDSLATASIRFSSSVSGIRTRNGFTSQVDASRNLIESGLEGNETTRTWDGMGTSTHLDSIVTAAGTRSGRSSTSKTTLARVVVPQPWARDSWPLSGTVTTHLVTSDGVDQTSVLSFTGTRYATLTIGDNTTTVDLARPPGGPGGRGGRRGRGGPGGPGGFGGPGGLGGDH